MSTASSSAGESTIQIHNHPVSTEHVAQVLGKTGTMLGRLWARMKLSYTLGTPIARDSLNELLTAASISTLQKIEHAYEGSKKPSRETSQITALKKRTGSENNQKQTGSSSYTRMNRVLAAIRSVVDITDRRERASDTGPPAFIVEFNPSSITTSTIQLSELQELHKQLQAQPKKNQQKEFLLGGKKYSVFIDPLGQTGFTEVAGSDCYKIKIEEGKITILGAQSGPIPKSPLETRSDETIQEDILREWTPVLREALRLLRQTPS